MTTEHSPGRRRGRLQAKLFWSHLGVMLLALSILVLVAAVVGLFLSDVGPRGGRSAAGRALLTIVISGIVAAGLAASVVARLAARRITEPIQAAGNATRRMASGNYAVRVPPGDSLELAALAEDINALAAELEETETRRLQLIGDVAHELRTPLQTIEGSMEALMDGVVEPTAETFAAIADEASRLKRLAADLSTLSKSQEDSYRLDLHPLDLATLLRDAAELLRHQFEAAGVQLQVETASPVEIHADADRLAQILTNVVGNSLAYTARGGTVTVSLGIDHANAVVRIADTGRGISATDLAHVFERFYRVDDQASTGTGVGLTIARSLARANGGDITASSPGVGKGAVFDVMLPLG
jgi:signal transduction histidine kinase